MVEGFVEKRCSDQTGGLVFSLKNKEAHGFAVWETE